MQQSSPIHNTSLIHNTFLASQVLVMLISCVAESDKVGIVLSMMSCICAVLVISFRQVCRQTRAQLLSVTSSSIQSRKTTGIMSWEPLPNSVTQLMSITKI